MAITTQQVTLFSKMPALERVCYHSWVSEQSFVFIRHGYLRLGVGEVELIVEATPYATGKNVFRLLAEIHELLAPWDNSADIGDFGVDPEDSARLLELYQAIDTHLGWSSDADEERGDYVGRIREVGLLLTGAKDEEG